MMLILRIMDSALCTDMSEVALVYGYFLWTMTLYIQKPPNPLWNKDILKYIKKYDVDNKIT